MLNIIHIHQRIHIISLQRKFLSHSKIHFILNDDISFRYPENIRKVIYTTIAIEPVHRQFMQLTKTEVAFLNENSLLKQLYLGLMNA